MPDSVKLRDLVVLGLLTQQPRYGYEIKMIIDNVMSHVIDISSGSLYYGIKKLQQRGLVEEDSIEKIGRRPERSVYRITEPGKQFFSAELPRVIFPRARPYFPMDLALYFFEFMDKKEQARRLKMRLEYLKHLAKLLKQIKASSSSAAPDNQLFIFTHRLRYISMEQSFIKELLEHLVGQPDYQLNNADLYEIGQEFEAFKKHLKVETVLSDPAPAKAKPKKAKKK